MTNNDSITISPLILPKRHTNVTIMEPTFFELVQNFNKAIDNQDYNVVIHYTTLALLDQSLLLQQRIKFLDTRAYAYSKQNQLNLAIDDALQIIRWAPMLADGYVCKANIFEMHGKIEYTIAAYDEGLRHILSGGGDQIHAQQLEEIRHKTLTRYHIKQIDFVGKLPIEILNAFIVPLLSPSTKATCLLVSKVWREKILACPFAWKSLLLRDNDKNVTQIVDIIPFAGCHIKHLTIENTNTSSKIDATCFKFMENGYFSKIKSFKMKVYCSNQHRQSNPYQTTLATGLWQIRKTLTILDLDFGDRKEALGLSDIIDACISLTKLTFTTTLSLTDLPGNPLAAEQHNALIDLKINAKVITGQDIKPILQRCWHLRRLIMNTCDTSVFHIINKHVPALETLAYNSDIIIPELQTITANTMKENKGLTSIYTNNGSASVSTVDVLPVIYNNKTTLQTFNAFLSPINENELQYLFTIYPDFKLDYINDLTFWGGPGIQEFILYLIRNTTTLTKLHAVDIYNIDNFVNAIVNLPCISELALSYGSGAIGHPGLTRAFKRYAAASKAFHPSLKCIKLQYCPFISNVHLATLAAIGSLESIILRGLTNVSTNGINNMIDHLRHHEALKYLVLAGMDAIKDSTLLMLGDLKHVSYINLENTKWVTDQGICTLVDKVDYSSALIQLVVIECPKITPKSIDYAKQKIDIVEYSI